MLPSSKSSRPRRRPLSDMNVVPYIDVMLVLVIILMITAPLLTQGVHVNLPQAAAKALPPKKDEPIIVTVNQKGDLFLNVSKAPEQAITPQDLMSTVSERLETAKTQNKEQDVFVKGDRDANYGAIMKAMVLLQKAGAEDVGLVTTLQNT
ncbi:MAG: protein TolR [Gammaproteobacteria bacterium RIFCSPHIGHO2_12_FULL_42_13]|nr:MAG: protein TolR [Gammaproteobacteria bacterium RIFCSPHIGHO2_12_FULL_42_13]